MFKKLSPLLVVALSGFAVVSACRKTEPFGSRPATPAATPPATAPAATPAAATDHDPVARLLAHTTAMIDILKANEADPARAIQELTAYQQRNQTELDREKQAMSELMQRDPMKIAAASSLYGMRSTELEARTAEAKAKARAKAR